MWTDSNELLLSVVDQNGAGSGEGMMKLFSFNEKGSWRLAGCYYFGGSYNDPATSGDYFAYSSMLSKQKQKSINECDRIVVSTIK